MTSGRLGTPDGFHLPSGAHGLFVYHLFELRYPISARCRDLQPINMSIVTKTGDQGMTSLMYNRKVSKTHPRVEAYGCVDELNATLGLARAHSTGTPYAERLLEFQRQLVLLMGELATASEDRQRYVRDGYPRIAPDHTAKLDALVEELEAAETHYRGWAMPGGNAFGAALDLSRTVCRRAERRVCALQELGELHNSEIIVYLNRMSDLLWLLARRAEGQTTSATQATA